MAKKTYRDNPILSTDDDLYFLLYRQRKMSSKHCWSALGQVLANLE